MIKIRTKIVSMFAAAVVAVLACTGVAYAQTPAISGWVSYDATQAEFYVKGGTAETIYADVLVDDKTVAKHLSCDLSQITSGSSIDQAILSLELLANEAPENYTVEFYYAGEADEALTAQVYGVYAQLGESGTDLIGVRTQAATDSSTPSFFAPATYVKDGITYKLLSSEPVSDGNSLTYTYQATTLSETVSGSISYIDEQGNLLRQDTIEGISDQAQQTRNIPESITVVGDKGMQTYRTLSTEASVTATWGGQIDFVIQCAEIQSATTGSYTATIQYMDGDKVIFQDTLTVDKPYRYTLPNTFYQRTGSVTTVYELNQTENVLTFDLNGDTHDNVTIPVAYKAITPDQDLTWTIEFVDGSEFAGTVVKAETQKVSPDSTATYNAPDTIQTDDGKTLVLADKNEFTYTYGDANIVQQIYYVSEGYVAPGDYNVEVRYVNLLDGSVLQTETLVSSADALEDLSITGPETLAIGDENYVRLAGQDQPYLHSYYSGQDTYTIYYRNVNDDLNANAVINSVHVIETDRVVVIPGTTTTTTTTGTAVTGGTANDTGAISTENAAATAVDAGLGAGAEASAVARDGESVALLDNEGADANANERVINENETPLANGESTTGAAEESQESGNLGFAIAGVVVALVAAGVIVVLVLKRKKAASSTLAVILAATLVVTQCPGLGVAATNSDESDVSSTTEVVDENKTTTDAIESATIPAAGTEGNDLEAEDTDVALTGDAADDAYTPDDGIALTSEENTTTSDVSNKNASVSMEALEGTSIDKSTILNGLGIATQFAVFADTFRNTVDMEGNIAVNTLTETHEFGISANTVQHITKLTVSVTKSVVNGSDGTFAFGLFDKDKLDTPVQTIKITTSGGSGKGTFNLDVPSLGTKEYQVFELDDQGNKLTEGEENDGYKVSYSSDNPAISVDGIMATGSVNYIRQLGESVNQVKVKTDGDLVVTADTNLTLSDNKTCVQYIDGSEFDAIMPISSMLEGQLSDLSRTLAQAKSGSGVKVYNLDPSAYQGSNDPIVFPCTSEELNTDTFVINVVIPNGEDTFTVGGSNNDIYLGSQAISNPQGWDSSLAPRILWNFVTESGEPYTGEVSFAKMTMGTFLLPQGTLYSTLNAPQLDIAKNVIQSQGEIHKMPFGDSTEHTASVAVTNTKQGGTTSETTSVSGTKTWKNSDGSELAEGLPESIIVTLQQSLDGKGWTNVETKEVTAKDGWKYSFVNLPKYNNGSLISYRVIEAEVEGFDTSYDASHLNITNTKKSESLASVTASLSFGKSYFGAGEFTEGQFSFVLKSAVLVDSEDGTSWAVSPNATAASVVADDKCTDDGNNSVYLTTTNAAPEDGLAQVSFPAITYEKEGTYYYLAYEDQASVVSGVDMDPTKFLVCVEVTKDSEGKLKAESSYQMIWDEEDPEDIGQEDAIFYNSDVMALSGFAFRSAYAAPSTQKVLVDPKVSKVLNGRALTADEFAFQMKETTQGSEGKTWTAKNDVAGTVEFDLLAFTEPGVYTYEISEVTGIDATVAYDTKTILLTVNVTMSEEGVLSASSTYSVDGQAVDLPTFVNEASGVSLKVQKTSADSSGDALVGELVISSAGFQCRFLLPD